MYAELLVLRIVHVLGAVIWVGTSLFIGIFLMPSLASVGPAGGAVMGELNKRRLFTIIPIIATLTMLAGLRLMWIPSNGYSAAYFATRGGMSYLVGAICAVLAFTIFMSVSHPAISQALKLGPQIAQAPDAEKPALMAKMNAIRGRAQKAGAASALLLIATAIAMAIGRYV